MGEEQSTATTPRRIKYAVWNCGGLSAHLNAGILCWARQEGVDVLLLLQETHWSQAMEWQDENWCYVRSAAKKPRTGGVMAVLSRRSVDAGTLRWNELVPGRLLHIRCDLQGTPIDILNVYQKVRVAGSEEMVQKNIGERAHVWAQLDKWSRSVPRRNVVLVAGDFKHEFPSHGRLHRQQCGRKHSSSGICVGSGGAGGSVILSGTGGLQHFRPEPLRVSASAG